MIIASFVLTAGCRDNIKPPTVEQLDAFGAAGPAGPSVDTDKLTKAQVPMGPYRVIPGDVLEVSMPQVLSAVTSDYQGAGDVLRPIVCRIGLDGEITLPIVGSLNVTDKSLEEIEDRIVAAYYPKYAKHHPSVYVRILEHHTFRVSIGGAITRPGVYSLRYDQMSLVNLILEAGGIVEDGAAMIRIIRAQKTQNEIVPASDPEASSFSPNDDAASNQENAAHFSERDADLNSNQLYAAFTRHQASHTHEETFLLPVRGLQIPFVDVVIFEGDTVVVEDLQMPAFTVLGLVGSPGNYPYPPHEEYNLMEAIAFAGGMNMDSTVRWAKIYRLTANGEFAHAAFKIDDPKQDWPKSQALTIRIKPGDIIALEHTPRTRTKAWLDQVFRFTIGAYVPLTDLIE